MFGSQVIHLKDIQKSNTGVTNFISATGELVDSVLTFWLCFPDVDMERVNYIPWRPS